MDLPTPYSTGTPEGQASSRKRLPGQLGGYGRPVATPGYNPGAEQPFDFNAAPMPGGGGQNNQPGGSSPGSDAAPVRRPAPPQAPAPPVQAAPSPAPRTTPMAAPAPPVAAAPKAAPVPMPTQAAPPPAAASGGGMTRAEYEKIYGPEPVGGAWENKNGGWVWNPTGNRQAIFDWNARLQAMADQGQLHRDAQGNIITGGASAGHGSPVATVNPNTWDVGRYTGGDIVNGVPRNLPPVLGGTGTQPFDFNSPEANRLRPNLANRRRY